MSQTITASGFCQGGLVTASEYYALMNLSAPSNSTQIQAAINYASDLIRNKVGRKLLTIADDVTVIEITDGCDNWKYVPAEAPVVSVTSIEYYNATEWTELDTGVHEFYTDGNVIATRERSVVFVGGYQNWRFTYTIGWPSFPEDLKMAVCLTARTLVDRASKRTDLASQADGEQSFSYFGPKQIQIPDEAKEIIARYKRNRPLYRFG